ncbi:HD-GYP domain-containing protein [Treponema phagedenis]|uniref:HD-GYP domain-containing protein n=1 Tax=Treponema phagedenis TaxID=162 RepID=UPI0002F9F7FE|nr:HD-GYP domain-containing protein [Treponema phagedenis]TYT78005.1 HD-GYP domain-containing protein [Treponema phagedenis]
MLKRIKTSDLQLGMSFSAPVFFDDEQNMLLNKKEPIGQRELNALKNWDVPFIVTEGTIIQNTATSSPDQIKKIEPLYSEIKDSFLAEDRKQTKKIKSEPEPRPREKLKQPAKPKAKILLLPQSLKSSSIYENYCTIIYELHDILKKIQKKEDLPIRPTDTIAEELYTLTENNTNDMLQLVLNSDVKDYPFAKVAVHTAILCIPIAKKLNLPSQRIRDLVISALLHDIGMQQIPEETLKKKENLTLQESQMITAHTQYAQKYITDTLLYTNIIAQSVLQHHERWDGQGYPNGLSGQAIDLGARIIAVADAYVAMLMPRAYRSAMSGYQAMKNLLADNARRFDPEVIKAMIQVIGIYPIGSLVIMNTGALARIIAASATTPLKPTIRILIDEEGKTFLSENGQIIDLAANKALFIVKPVNIYTHAKNA